MKITFEVGEEFTDLEKQVLALALGNDLAVEEVEPEPAAKPAAKKTTPAKKAAPKPEPEPAAEEPIDDDDLIGDDDAGDSEIDDMSDEDLLDLAVKRATEMVAGGEAAKVREALDAAGASRVRELNTDNVREFFKALS